MSQIQLHAHCKVLLPIPEVNLFFIKRLVIIFHEGKLVKHIHSGAHREKIMEEALTSLLSCYLDSISLLPPLPYLSLTLSSLRVRYNALLLIVVGQLGVK